MSLSTPSQGRETTVVLGRRHGRRAGGIEIHAEYVEVALERLASDYVDTSQQDNSASLSDPERDVLSRAGTAPSPTVRRQSVAIVLAKTGSVRSEARDLLTASFGAPMQPSFHYIPRGDAMADEQAFAEAYRKLAAHTEDFTNVDQQQFVAALTASPDTLAPLRMILGFTYNELAQAMRLTRPGTRTRGDTLKRFERSAPPHGAPTRQAELIETIAATVLAIMERNILQIPASAQEFFHSKLDKRDTIEGWRTVAANASGVPIRCFYTSVISVASGGKFKTRTPK